MSGWFSAGREWSSSSVKITPLMKLMICLFFAISTESSDAWLTEMAGNRQFKRNRKRSNQQRRTPRKKLWLGGWRTLFSWAPTWLNWATSRTWFRKDSENLTEPRLKEPKVWSWKRSEASTESSREKMWPENQFSQAWNKVIWTNRKIESRDNQPSSKVTQPKEFLQGLGQKVFNRDRSWKRIWDKKWSNNPKSSRFKVGDRLVGWDIMAITDW